MAAPSRSRHTPLARAIRPPSRSRPSLTSSMALAPATAAWGPAARGGVGRRWWSRHSWRMPPCSPSVVWSPSLAWSPSVAWSPPASSRRSPAAERPSVPQTATRVPGAGTAAQHRGPPLRSPSAVTETSSTPGGADERSPPATATPASAAPRPRPWRSPAPRPPACRVGDEGDQHRRADGTHGGEIREVLGQQLRPHVRGAGPLVEPVPSPHHRIGGGDHGPGSGDDGRVVPRPHEQARRGVKNGKIDPSRPSSDTPPRVWAGVIMTPPSWRDGRSTETVASGWPGHRPGWFTRGASPGKPD